MSDDEADGGYKVGYGKPPKHSQFKKGGPGNPGPRKKPARTLNQEVAEALKVQVSVTQNGERRTMSLLQAALAQAFNKAAAGDAKAMKLLVELARQSDQAAELTAVINNAAAAQVVTFELPKNGR
jgi:hypothetical protein